MFYDLQQYAFLTKPFMKHTTVLICTPKVGQTFGGAYHFTGSFFISAWWRYK